jgi:sulfite reductase (ferredoxin)
VDVAEPQTNSLSKAEQRKLDSDHLREPLLTELGNDEVRFSEDAVQLLKFHGSYQQHHRELRKTDKVRSWQMMLRLRSPGGRIPAQLFLALDELSNRIGDGTLRTTTRQAFQMHGIPKADLKEVIGTIVRNLGSTLAACGDINRNVMAPPAPFEKGGYPAARQLADEIADLLSPEAAEGSYLDLWVDGDLSYRFKPSKAVKQARKRQSEGGVYSGSEAEPLYGDTYLPRKFKVGVTVPGDNSIDLLTQDIGLVAFTHPSGELKGCNVYVGGGMGRTHNKEETFARIADPLGYVAGRTRLRRGSVDPCATARPWRSGHPAPRSNEIFAARQRDSMVPSRRCSGIISRLSSQDSATNRNPNFSTIWAGTVSGPGSGLLDYPCFAGGWKES